MVPETEQFRSLSHSTRAEYHSPLLPGCLQASDSQALKRCLEYSKTNWGRGLVQEFKQLHAALFPAYFLELQGIAAGSGMPFDTASAAEAHACVCVCVRVRERV